MGFAPPPLKSKPSGGKKWLTVIVVILIGVGATMSRWRRWFDDSDSHPGIPKVSVTSTPDRLLIRAEESTVIRDVKPGDAQYAQIQAFFQAFAAPASDINSLVDRDQMIKLASIKAPKGYGAGLAEGLTQTLRELRLNPGFDWSRHRIMKVTVSDDGGRAIVVTRVPMGEGFLTQRWWLRGHNNAWRIYDCADVELGLRITDATRCMAEKFGDNATQAAVWSRNLAQAAEAAQAEDPEALDRALSQLRVSNLPKELEDVVSVFSACAAMYREQYDDTIEGLKHCDLPVANVLKARAHLSLGQWDQTLKELDKYQAVVGASSLADGMRGMALIAKAQPAQAKAAFERGILDGPDNLECLVGLVRLATRDEVAGLARRVVAQRDATPALYEVSRQLHVYGEAAKLVPLCTELLTLRPGDYGTLYCMGLGFKAQRDWPMAAQAMRMAMEKCPADEVVDTQSEMVECHLLASQPAAAWQAAPDKPSAFRQIGDWILDDEDWSPLKEVIALHERQHGSDPYMHYCKAQLHMEAAEWAQALGVLDGALVLQASTEDHDLLERSWRFVMYRLDKGLEAYQRPGSQDKAFSQLTGLCLADEKYELLTQLAEEHRKNSPAAPEIPIALARMRFQQKNYEQALAEIQKIDPKTVTDDGQLTWWLENIAVRANIRLGRLDAAMSAARKSTARDDDPYYEVVVAICGKNLAEAQAAVEKWVGQGVNTEWLYNDEDAAAAMEQPTMAPLKTKYPPPVEAETQPSPEMP